MCPKRGNLKEQGRPEGAGRRDLPLKKI